MFYAKYNIYTKSDVWFSLNLSHLAFAKTNEFIEWNEKVIWRRRRRKSKWQINIEKKVHISFSLDMIHANEIPWQQLFKLISLTVNSFKVKSILHLEYKQLVTMLILIEVWHFGESCVCVLTVFLFFSLSKWLWIEFNYLKLWLVQMDSSRFNNENDSRNCTCVHTL